MDFKASVSLVRTMRWSIYGASLVGLAIAWWTNGFAGAFLLIGAGWLAFMWVLDRLILSKAPRIGDVVVSLKQGSIDAPLFNTKRKSYAWSDIESAKVDTVSGATVLELKLVPATDRPDKRAFLDGVNHARPFLPLQSLSPVDQEQLLDAVLARLRGASAAALADSAAPMVNDLTLARQLDERLKEMTPTAWLTLALIALNVGVWLVTASLGSGWMTGDADRLYELGGNAASAVQDGEWWRLLTSMFLHADALHLLFNMVGLYAVGRLVEQIFGHVPFLVIYLASGVAGSVASLHFGAQQNVSVGASGAVFGIAGALLVVVYRHRESLPRLFNRQILGGMAFFVGYSLLMGFSKAGVDNAAHLGGLAAGALLGFLLPARFDVEHHARVVTDRVILAVGLLGAVLTWAAFQAPPAQVDVGVRAEAKRATTAAALAFDQAMKAVQQDAVEVKAGTMTDREADDRSRGVHAPRMKKVLDQLNALPPDAANPAAEVVADLRGLAQALHAYMAMASMEVDGKMQPADAARGRQLEADIKHFNDRMRQRLERQKNPSASPGG